MFLNKEWEWVNKGVGYDVSSHPTYTEIKVNPLPYEKGGENIERLYDKIFSSLEENTFLNRDGATKVVFPNGTILGFRMDRKNGTLEYKNLSTPYDPYAEVVKSFSKSEVEGVIKRAIGRMIEIPFKEEDKGVERC